MLEFLIFVFDRSFQPVLTVQIHHNPTLIKSVPALKFSFHRKGKEFFIRLHLQNGCIVIPEMIICPLPQICVGIRYDFNAAVRYRVIRRFSCPFEFAAVKIHIDTSIYAEMIPVWETAYGTSLYNE